MKPTTKSNARKHEKQAVVIVILSMLAVAGMLFTTYLSPPAVRGLEDTNNLFFPGQGGAEAGHLPYLDEDALREQMQKKADESLLAFKINPLPVFGSGGEGNLRIENPNHNKYPFVVEIILRETGEKVYDSGGILPNHHINTARLTRALPAGSHEATAYIRVYDPVTNEYRGKAAAEMILYVQ